jgi:phage terminase large subunit-like protein
VIDPVLAEAGRRVSAAESDPRLIWRRCARPEQKLPKGVWRIWFIRGGRGSGKTRSGAGALAEWVLEDTDGEGEYGIIAPTYADAWTKCVEGEAGILRALGTSMAEIKDHRSLTVRSAWRTYGQVIMHNGVIIYADSAAEGGLRIQGRNLKGAWADEIGLWDKWEIAWRESLVYAVRTGRAQIIATGTPKASRLARRLVRSLLRDDPEHGGVVNTRLRTVDNIANLAETFARSVIGAARGTRLERQELEGELLEDVANALWPRDLLDQIRCGGVGQEGGPEHLMGLVMGVDPSDGSEESDEQAYTIAGKGPVDDGHIYVAESWGGQEAPAAFAKRCIRKAMEWNATIVVEKNHGGAWLREVFAQAQRDMGTSVRVAEVHASQAKRTRAEPVSAMYERYAKDGKPLVRHCHRVDKDDQGHPVPDDHMGELEDQMATFTGAQGERSPDRLDSLVWAMHRFLKVTFGPTGESGVRQWAAQADLDREGEGLMSRARKRRATPHQRAQDDQSAWTLDGFAPGTEDPQRPGRRNNVRRWS